MMEAVGFDFTHGRLSVSHHPFCGGVPTDVRITTRYTTGDFLSSLMGVLHETGHALYEQNLPKAWSHWPLGKARGMAVHESQSLFVEKQLGRNPAFWHWALPLVEQHLGESWSLDDILPHVHHVERGLIRVDADEVTYPLHVILRYELEQELVAGRLEVRRRARGVGRQDARLSRPLDHRQSDRRADAGRALAVRRLRLFPVLHAGRDDGGAAMGGADQASILPSTTTSRSGHFDAVNDWRRENIWSQGSRWSTPELLERATGEKLNAVHFTSHLQEALRKRPEPLGSFGQGLPLESAGAGVELQLRQPRIDAALGDEALVRAFLDDAAVVHAPGCGRPSARSPGGGR